MCFFTCEMKIAVKEIPANKNGNKADFILKAKLSSNRRRRCQGFKKQSSKLPIFIDGNFLYSNFHFASKKTHTVCKKIVRDQQGKFLWIKTYNWQENYFQSRGNWSFWSRTIHTVHVLYYLI
jgi:hypothetical protein